MAIRNYEGDIHRDYDVFGTQVYAGNGQGCGTVFYESVPQARAVIKAHGGHIPEGKDSGLCSQCSCSYPSFTPEYRAFPAFACAEWKRQVAQGR